jgi:hypothetical protein
MRVELFRWFCSIRGSVKGRIPLRLLRAQAEEQREEYLAACLRLRVVGRAPRITPKWLLAFRREYNISLRCPNKRWKVSKSVLLERLRILWANLFRIRQLILLTHGYDCVMENFDQKPFHMNEAGSKMAKTLDWRGRPCVELKECHASTRARWTATTWSSSASDACAGGLQTKMPLECLFKGGEGVLKTLTSARETLISEGCFGNLQWLSVATSDSGSYATPQIVQMLERHLEPWSDTRQWRILLCDAYKPHADEAVRRLCWNRGYIVVLHGGGTTGVLQVPDTHMHSLLSREYQELEMRDLVTRMQLEPSKLPLRIREDCMRDLVTVYTRGHLHRQTSLGFTHNMLTSALDGSEDHLGRGDAVRFWQELHMDKLRRQIMADVADEHAAGRLPWTYDTVQSLLEDFPARGQLDRLEEGQDDEGETVEENQGFLWDDNVEAVSPDVSDAESQGEADGVSALADDLGVAAQPLLDSMAALDRLHEQALEVEDPRILNVIDAARRKAAKAAMGANQDNHQVVAAMRTECERRRSELMSQQAAALRHREALASLEREREELQKSAEALRKQQADLRAAAERRSHAVACDSAARGFDAEMFGQGKPEGGGPRCKACRWDAFQRVFALLPNLPPEVANNLEHDWPKWDGRQAARYGSAWGSQYRNTLQRLLALSQDGQGERALSWWQGEVHRKVPIPELVIPAMPAVAGPK